MYRRRISASMKRATWWIPRRIRRIFSRSSMYRRTGRAGCSPPWRIPRGKTRRIVGKEAAKPAFCSLLEKYMRATKRGPHIALNRRTALLFSLNGEAGRTRRSGEEVIGALPFRREETIDSVRRRAKASDRGAPGHRPFYPGRPPAAERGMSHGRLGDNAP